MTRPVGIDAEREKLSPHEFGKLFGASLNINAHAIQAQTAMNIGAAIRARFGLPPKEEDLA